MSTALLLASIVTLVPEEPQRVPERPAAKALAVSEPAKAVHGSLAPNDR